MTAPRLLLLLPLACGGVGGLLDTEGEKPAKVLDVHGRVVSGSVPVAGAEVYLVEHDQTRATVVTDEAGRFRFDDRITCGGFEWYAMSSHPDYFVHYPGWQHPVLIQCKTGRQDVILELAARSRALVFHPADATVQAGGSLLLSATIIYANGWESDLAIHMHWMVSGPAAQCGSFAFSATAKPTYLAPLEPPPEQACGGPAGRVRIDLRVYDDAKALVPGATGHTFLTVEA